MFEMTHNSLAYSANVSVKGGPTALVERDPNEDRASSHFILTIMAKEWLEANVPECEFWDYGDQAQLFFKTAEDRLTFVKWSSTLNKKKGKKS